MSKLDEEKTIILLWGLPGSGKTTYANEICKQPGFRQRSTYSESPFKIIDLDYYKDRPDRMRHLKSDTDAYLRSRSKLILDGFVVTNLAATNILEMIYKDFDSNFLLSNKSMFQLSSYKLKYEIVLWEPDVEACIWNDFERRFNNSKITIENAKFEEPSDELIKKFNITITRKKVVKKPNHAIWARMNGVSLNKDDTMTSESWCLGGTAGSCWSDEKSNVSSSPQPVSFERLDDLLSKVCPNINFMKYKEISNQFVSIETTGDSDYYGGHTEYAHYECNIKDLYDYLLENGDIKEPTYKSVKNFVVPKDGEEDFAEEDYDIKGRKLIID